MNVNEPVEWSELESKLGYAFRDKSLLETALTHSSYANEQSGVESNERLEFLGDAVTGLEVALLIFEAEPRLSEGRMTTARAALVRTENLAKIARQLDLGRSIRLGVGAEKTEVRENDTALEDAFEALMAAVFLDGGPAAARMVIRRLFTEAAGDQPDLVSDAGRYPDYKSRLQMKLQEHGAAEITYRVEDESGPDHDKIFRVSVSTGGDSLGTGEGKTKKNAEQMAAKMALEGLRCI